MKRQLAVAALMLVISLGLFASISLLARHEPLAEWMEQMRWERAEQARLFFADTGYFDDVEDRLVLDELPALDTAQGGVYVIGASNVAWGALFHDLTPEQRRLIHNFGIGASNHTMQWQFLQFLIDHKRLLSAGGDKTLVILGASYHYGARAYEPNGFFVNLWKRHGFYDCTLEDGIQPVPVSPAWRFYETERTRVAGFLNAASQRCAATLKDHLHGTPKTTPRQHDVQVHNNRWIAFMGPEWKTHLQEQMQSLAHLIQELQQRNVQVVVVLMPHASWEDNLPYEAAYRLALNDVVQATGVPMQDWSDLLSDEEFADANHANLPGIKKLEQAYLELAVPHLRRTGALP